MISYSILKACSQDNSTLLRLIEASNQLRRTYNRLPNPTNVEGWQLKQRIEQLNHVIEQARNAPQAFHTTPFPGTDWILAG